MSNGKTYNEISCAIIGAQEKDLYILGELHKQESVRIVYIYDPHPKAVGLEIAEILRIPRYFKLEDIPSGHIDYVVVSEPRERYLTELERLGRQSVKILTQAEALTVLCEGKTPPEPGKVPDYDIYTIDDALVAFEKLLDRKEMLKFLLDVAVKAARASAGSIMLYSKETEELYIAYAIGLSERVIKSTRQRLGEGIAGSVAQEKKGKLIHLNHELAVHTAGRERLDLASAISVPLIWDGALLGVLNVSSGKADPPLGEQNLVTLKRLSRRISRVLFKSLKLQETQVRHREMNLRYSVGELSEKTISAREKFSLLSTLLSDLVGATTVEIFISTHEGDWFVLGGSSRSAPPSAGRVLYDRGALSRCLIEKRAIILSESVADPGNITSSISSLVFVPITLATSLGVMVLEFTARYKLDEFMLVKDSISLEVSRFIASVLRERRLKRELEALGKVSDFAPALLSCKSFRDLSELISRLVADILECERVSVRISSGDLHGLTKSFHEPPGERSSAWTQEDDERFRKLQERREPFSLAFLNFTPSSVEPPPSYHSVLAFPVANGQTFYGGIIAYDKNPAEPMDDATFTDLDRMVLKSLVSLVTPVLTTLLPSSPAEAESETAVYEKLLEDNLSRIKKMGDNEISRSDRYHHSFSVFVFKIPMLNDVFEKDYQAALSLVNDISQGIQTRTRKSDYGTWTDRDTFVMINLEGSRRVRFLISRLVVYLKKDLANTMSTQVSNQDIFYGLSIYPGRSKTADDLIQEATSNLKPYSDS